MTDEIICTPTYTGPERRRGCDSPELRELKDDLRRHMQEETSEFRRLHDRMNRIEEYHQQTQRVVAYVDGMEATSKAWKSALLKILQRLGEVGALAIFSWIVFKLTGKSLAP